MVPILAVVSDVRGGYICSLSCSNLELKQRYQKELLLRASTKFRILWRANSFNRMTINWLI